MYAAALRLELRFRDVQSLKEKRKVLKALQSHLQQTFDVAVAEIDHQDKWQRATLGVVMVSAQAGHLERKLHTVRSAVEARPDVDLLEYAVGYLEES